MTQTTATAETAVAVETDGENPAARTVTRRLGWTLVAMVAFWGSLIFYVVDTQLPSNALRLPGQEQLRLSVTAIAPQGWAFFTKSPRDPQIGVWRLSVEPSGRKVWLDAKLTPHSELRNVLGFNRRSRAQGVELGILQTAVPRDKWTPCRGADVSACFDRVPSVLTLHNSSPDPIHCGSIGLVQREPLPWAWAGSTTVMPAKVARIEVTC
ncbi:SdpA family antimicrobial peptide system protein [Planotetraspora sp. A-T 1434]|uniref:SdpA family antimicrobial peptide system protein n=1 Tax=Planotetraspora sp. A-T 1434 TaxID=2979219 RepID=UPI0021BEAE6A|nr:SdpA family antimicrobial peptide system protein [Planotetraspora sp. A-T 1434]MCT9928955.1 SdpA family antimicrobial peptide system protein [Planotetraspora sp. A-T 1434]